jgi:hypothetical protein
MSASTPKPITTALIGLGYAGKVFHSSLLLSLPHLFTIRYIVEKFLPDELLQGNTFSNKFGAQAQLISDYTEALVDPDVDLVSANHGVFCGGDRVVFHIRATGTAPHPLTNLILQVIIATPNDTHFRIAKVFPLRPLHHFDFAERPSSSLRPLWKRENMVSAVQMESMWRLSQTCDSSIR